MKGTIVPVVSHEGVHPQTSAMLAELQQRGARLMVSQGNADVAAGRNLVMTRCLRDAVATGCDVMLCVDDDMVCDAQHVVELVGRARATGVAHSGVYSTAASALAATQMPSGRYLVGMGMLAIPVPLLQSLAEKLGTIMAYQDLDMVPFCQSGPIGGRWVSEDYQFCLRLGGVVLDHRAPCGHLNTVALWPDDETLRKIAAGELLGKPDPQPKRKETQHAAV